MWRDWEMHRSNLVVSNNQSVCQAVLHDLLWVQPSGSNLCAEGCKRYERHPLDIEGVAADGCCGQGRVGIGRFAAASALCISIHIGGVPVLGPNCNDANNTVVSRVGVVRKVSAR